MKEIKLYMCEFCGTKYKSGLECKDCEDSHKKAKKIIKQGFQPYKVNNTGYPNLICVEFEDGTTRVYELRNRSEI
jgi:hypothetical protein